MVASIALGCGGKGLVWRITSEKEAVTAQSPVTAFSSSRRGRRPIADGITSSPLWTTGFSVTKRTDAGPHLILDPRTFITRPYFQSPERVPGFSLRPCQRRRDEHDIVSGHFATRTNQVTSLTALKR